MKTLRLIIEILLVILVICFIVKDCRHGMVCEGVYMEHDTTTVGVYYYDSNTGQFKNEPNETTD